MRMTSCWLVSLGVACASGSNAPAPESPTTATEARTTASDGQAAAVGSEPEHVVPPFSAEQLRTGIPVGTEIRYRVESAGSPAVIQHWVFTAADERGCTIHSRVLAEDGSLIEDEGEGTSTWAELESHAHFPAATTTRSESTVEVPAGRFETWLFEVRPAEADAPVSRYHFARELPGPPVWMEVSKGGTVVRKMELLSRTQP